jgi:hypothetical protein
VLIVQRSVMISDLNLILLRCLVELLLLLLHDPRPA